MWLPDQVFKTVISSTPLISIDLVVRNEKNKVLLGKRLNAPAKRFWFVPGGRMQKNETLDNAFIRLLREELDIESGIVREDANFLGIFEHFYNNNFFDGVTTNYIVLAYIVNVSKNQIHLQSDLQHQAIMWLDRKDIGFLNGVLHKYSMKYLNDFFG